MGGAAPHVIKVESDWSLTCSCRRRFTHKHRPAKEAMNEARQHVNYEKRYGEMQQRRLGDVVGAFVRTTDLKNRWRITRSAALAWLRRRAGTLVDRRDQTEFPRHAEWRKHEEVAAAAGILDGVAVARGRVAGFDAPPG